VKTVFHILFCFDSWSKIFEPGKVANTYNPSTGLAEAGKRRVQGQSDAR
jgi:hypothetical protein